jgi:hypothetical protein
MHIVETPVYDFTVHTPAPRPLTNSPWGLIQQVTQIAEGIWQVSTASHGGLKVSDQRLAAMPAQRRATPYSHDGWFEEDLDWALVAVSFPEAFRPDDLAMARQSLAQYYPDIRLSEPVRPAKA